MGSAGSKVDAGERVFASREETEHKKFNRLFLKEEETQRREVFHDLMKQRRVLSGYSKMALRRLAFKGWKMQVEKDKTMKLRSDQAISSLVGFLRGLAPGERELVLPGLVELRRTIEENRQRLREIKEMKLLFRNQHENHDLH